MSRKDVLTNIAVGVVGVVVAAGVPRLFPSPQAKRALLQGERGYVLMEGPLELEAFDGRLVVKGDGAMVFKPVPADPAPQTSER